MIKLAIQAPMIPEKLPRSLYELEVYSEHGDADHNETTSHRYAPNENDMVSLHMALEILEAYEKAGKPYMITQKEWVEFINSKGIDTSTEKYIEDWISEILAWDMTNDGQYLTTYQGYDLWFYDVNGLKRPVTVEHTDGSN